MPIPLMFLPQIAQAGLGVVQGIQGMIRTNNLDRPVRTTSPAVQEAAARTRYMAQAGEAPGSDVARENIRGTQAAAVSQAQKAGGSAASTLAAAVGAQANANKGMQQLGAQNAQFKLGANTQYLQALQQLAQEHEMNFQWNEAQKFQEEAAAAQALKDSGIQNIFGGMTNFAGTFMADQGLNQQDPTQSPYWNAKQGYMGTAEMYDAKQNAAIQEYMKKIAPATAPAASNPMHGKFGEGINTQGYMNPLPMANIPAPIVPSRFPSVPPASF